MSCQEEINKLRALSSLYWLHKEKGLKLHEKYYYNQMIKAAERILAENEKQRQAWQGEARRGTEGQGSKQI